MTENTPSRLEELKAATAEAETARTALEEKQDAYNAATIAREKKEVEIKQAAEDSGIKAALEDLGNKLKDLTTKFTGPEPEKKAFAKAVKTLLRETSLRPIPSFKDLNTCLIYTPALDAWKNFLQGTADKQVPDEQKSQASEALQKVHSAYERLKKEREDHKNAYEKLQAAEKAAKVAAISAKTALENAESTLKNIEATLNAPSAPAYVPKEAPAPKPQRATPNQPIASILSALLSNKTVGWTMATLVALGGLFQAFSGGSHKAFQTQPPRPKGTPTLTVPTPTPPTGTKAEQRTQFLVRMAYASYENGDPYVIMLKKFMLSHVELREHEEKDNPLFLESPNWPIQDKFIDAIKTVSGDAEAREFIQYSIRHDRLIGPRKIEKISDSEALKRFQKHQAEILSKFDGTDDDLFTEYYPDFLFDALWLQYLVQNAEELEKLYPHPTLEYLCEDIISTLAAGSILPIDVAMHLVDKQLGEMASNQDIINDVVETLKGLLPEERVLGVQKIARYEQLNLENSAKYSGVFLARYSNRNTILPHEWLTFTDPIPKELITITRTDLLRMRRHITHQKALEERGKQK